MTGFASRRYAAAAALFAALAIAAGGWFLSGSKKSVSVPRQSAAPVDTTHEKAFLKEQLQANSTHVPILLRLAQIERGEGDLTGARQHLEMALKGDGNLTDVHLELGLVFSQMNDPASAEAQNREVLRSDPRQADALYNLGALCANRGDIAQARTFWTDAVRFGGNSESADKARRAIQRLDAMQRGLVIPK
jgi:Tfp pilus assembly protein PilF